MIRMVVDRMDRNSVHLTDGFVFKFKWLAQSYYWDGSMKLLKLMETLTGKALDCLAWQKANVRASYELTKQQL